MSFGSGDFSVQRVVFVHIEIEVFSELIVYRVEFFCKLIIKMKIKKNISNNIR